MEKSIILSESPGINIVEPYKEDSKDYIESILKSVSDALIIVNPDATINLVNPSTSELLGYAPKELTGKPMRTILDIDAEEQNILFREMFRLEDLIEKEFISDYEIYLKTKKGKRIPVSLSGSLIRDKNRNVIGIVTVARDITERKKAEEQITKSLAEKEVLLREIHHRVKNNMNVISSLLGLQAMHVKDEADAKLFDISKKRIKSMAMVHEKLYQSENLAETDFKSYIQELIKEIVEGSDITGVDLQTDVEDIYFSTKFAIPCGLILNELITNALEHAFVGRENGIITVSLKEKNRKVELSVKDNGVGFPEGNDFKDTDSLGLQLVSMLAIDQLEGSVKLDTKKGTKFTIKFPLDEN